MGTESPFRRDPTLRKNSTPPLPQRGTSSSKAFLKRRAFLVPESYTFLEGRGGGRSKEKRGDRERGRGFREGGRRGSGGGSGQGSGGIRNRIWTRVWARSKIGSGQVFTGENGEKPCRSAAPAQPSALVLAQDLALGDCPGSWVFPQERAGSGKGGLPGGGTGLKEGFSREGGSWPRGGPFSRGGKRGVPGSLSFPVLEPSLGSGERV